MLAIADNLGGEWPARARAAARVLSAGGDEADEVPDELAILSDIREVFGERDKLATADILSELNAMEESPWPSRRRGEGLDARGLSRLLRPYKIRSRTVRLADGKTPKGYHRKQFEDAFARYLVDGSSEAPQAPHPPQPALQAGSEVADSAGSSATPRRLSAAHPPHETPHEKRDVADVAANQIPREPTLGADWDAELDRLREKFGEGQAR